MAYPNCGADKARIDVVTDTRHGARFRLGERYRMVAFAIARMGGINPISARAYRHATDREQSFPEGT